AWLRFLRSGRDDGAKNLASRRRRPRRMAARALSSSGDRAGRALQRRRQGTRHDGAPPGRRVRAVLFRRQLSGVRRAPSRRRDSAHDAGATPDSGVAAARWRDDSHDRLLVARLGHPATWHSRFDISPPVAAWTPPTATDDLGREQWRFETESDWPPLDQIG